MLFVDMQLKWQPQVASECRGHEMPAGGGRGRGFLAVAGRGHGRGREIWEAGAGVGS